MYRRARFIQATCLFLLALFFVASVYSHQEKKQELRISGFSRGIGAVNPGQTDLDVQKLTYRIMLSNPNRIQIVDTVEVVPSRFLKERVVQDLRQTLEYNDPTTITISGEIVFDAKGLSKEDVAGERMLTAVQFKGDDHADYFLPMPY